ncbi:hypothetical protein LTR56_000772 [Elasticomyces elasticus]|nr:hypothetical protein LTR22_009072 [Elasticomyces elasticus]KAK3660396.1 hypothetical protein LTR56_000772 [Elasticomyces elasticus]KAK4929213.1 hypothetical protein LTR49_004110 [Elasticomyces elasticus]KAK5765769.1 hypothetical protein LTS12_004029 [Elasticomyces elasticus]
MQQQEKLVDFVIACGPHEFKVHKAVICAQSDYFSAACSNSRFEVCLMLLSCRHGVADGIHQKGQSSDLITLKAIGTEDGDDKACDDPEIIKLMVHYFYYFDYQVASVDIATPEAERSPSSGLPFSDQNRPASAGAGLFGATKNNQQQNANPFANAGDGLFGNANPQQQTDNSLFGNSNNNAGGGLSGGQNKPATGGLFGATRCGPVDTQQETAAETDGNMIMHAKVYAVAVKYQVPALQDLATRKFVAAVAANWNHDSFAEAAHIVYTTTPDESRALRSVVVKTLLQYGSLLDKPAVEGLVCGISGLAFELLKGSRQGTTV